MSITEWVYEGVRGIALVLEFMLPYMKYLLFLFLIIGFLWVNRIVVTDPTLRPLLIQSFEDETHRISGKSISAFVCVVSFVLGWFIAILYSKDHVAPEWYCLMVVGLITSFYGLKEVGKIMTTKYNASSLDAMTNATSQPAAESPVYDDALLLEWKAADTELPFTEWYAQKQKSA